MGKGEKMKMGGMALESQLIADSRPVRTFVGKL